MDNKDIQNQLDEQQKALAMIYKSVEKTRKMIFWSGVVTTVTFVLPLIIVMVMLPKIIGTFTSSLDAFSGVQNSVNTESINIESLTESLNNLQGLGF